MCERFGFWRFSNHQEFCKRKLGQVLKLVLLKCVAFYYVVVLINTGHCSIQMSRYVGMVVAVLAILLQVYLSLFYARKDEMYLDARCEIWIAYLCGCCEILTDHSNEFWVGDFYRNDGWVFGMKSF